MKRLIAGNWKMNGLMTALDQAEAVDSALTEADLERADVLICPPLTLLAAMRARNFKHVDAGAQDCHAEKSGAFTGDVSAEMLAEIGATHVIVGHSERRQFHGETDAVVKAKAEAARAAGLVPIVCVGEPLETREAGRAIDSVTAQARASWPAGAGEGGEVVLAYEPVWAIGTGKVASPEDIAAMHEALSGVVGTDARILYGGSVKPENARDILGLDHVHGALVGGASLKADDFLGIIRA